MRIDTDLTLDQRTYRFVDLRSVLGKRLPHLPHVLRLISENHLRETGQVEPLLAALDAWLDGRKSDFEFSFRPNRILMHDTTCTPAIADIAGMRDALAEAGGDPELLSPTLPVEISVDHSLAVDAFGVRGAARQNAEREIKRNHERYAFMKWASANMEGVHVNPPGTGIMHTINLEQLATVLEIKADGTAHPDMLLGTDSHTPMINGIGVMGWGVGGLEAESVMFGQPVSLAMPEVVGVRLMGALPPTVLATDLALVVTHRLREFGVTGDFVEFFGPGVSGISAGERAVIANMAPEFGAATGFFAVDASTIDYLRATARPEQLCKTIEPVFRAMGLWFDAGERPRFDRELTIDLSALRPTIAGPRRPQDRCDPAEAQTRVEEAIDRPLNLNAAGLVPDGAVGVAAITSCTNTSDPRLLIAAGLLARKARARGLAPSEWIKTSLAPGSPSAEVFLERAGLLDDLSALGFDIVGFGCTTCIGNSGPLPDLIEDALVEGKAICAVLSGNRNFPGRVHPKLDLGYLASPPMVIAYALKGSIEGDILTQPLGTGRDGKPVFLRDIWPSAEEVDAVLQASFRADDVPEAFTSAGDNDAWRDIEFARSPRFPWGSDSCTLRRPKFVSLDAETRLGRYSAAPLLVLGDDMTTDHISPAGWIDPRSHAGKWLIERGMDPMDLNVYASYRGNWEVMLRGLFTNRLARNFLGDDLEPSYTELEHGERLPVFQAAEQLGERGVSSVILAGDRYGMGSSRDWAAKGVALLDCRAVIARGFERIHRANLIGMGVLPLQINDDFTPADAGIVAADRFDIDMSPDMLSPRSELEVTWVRPSGEATVIACRAAVDTCAEVELLRQGGVLTSILRKTLESAQAGLSRSADRANLAQ